MAELERKGAQIWEKEREIALNKFNQVIRKWKINMPNVEPQVLDFNLGKFYEYGLIEYWIANEEKEGYCGKFLFVFNNQSCPYHHHNFKHETFFVLKGKVEMQVEDKKIIKTQGEVLVMKPKIDHLFKGIGDALLLEVSKPCQPNDNIFEDKNIGENGIL